jgi:hypothetical protein
MVVRQQVQIKTNRRDNYLKKKVTFIFRVLVTISAVQGLPNGLFIEKFDFLQKKK